MLKSCNFFKQADVVGIRQAFEGCLQDCVAAAICQFQCSARNLQPILFRSGCVGKVLAYLLNACGHT